MPHHKPDDSFLASLGKFAAYIFVGWNTLWLCMFIPVFGLGIMLAAFSTAPTPSDKLGQLEHLYGDQASLNQLLMINVQGTIVGDSDVTGLGSLSGTANGYEIKQKLYEAAQRTEIKGVILEINSPGGTIYGAHAITDGVKYYRNKTKQPVFAHIQGVGASGAYWAASSADQIIADYGSEIGSIGVIMGPFKYYDGVVSESDGLLGGSVITQNGIQSVNITAGKSKDIGNPYRRLTADEQRQLQQSVNNEYDGFVSYVSQQRDIPSDTIRNQIGAMIYDNKSAQALGLIDSSGSREDAFVQLAKAAHLKDYQVMRELSPGSLVSSLLGAISHTNAPKASFDACALTRAPLAYYGSTVELCQK